MTASTRPDVVVGSLADMMARLRAVLPSSWFPLTAPGAGTSATPVLDGLLAGISTSWSYCYSLLEFVALQTRLATATGSLLDLISADFFGSSVKRQAGELDESFRSRIKANLLVGRATRTAVCDAVTALLGSKPVVIEPLRATDTGGYGGSAASGAGGGGGYGTRDVRLGSSTLPFQYLITLPVGITQTTRNSDASYLDSGGALRLAGRYVLRSTYANGVRSGSLTEGRGFNLIKDSVGWSGFATSSSTAATRWLVDPSGAGALWAQMPVMQVSVFSGGAVAGPSVEVYAADPVLTASAWIRLPADHLLQSLDLVVGSSGDSVGGSANLTIVGQWQRVSVTFRSQGNLGATLSISLNGTSQALMPDPFLTQCWQVEPGDVATSYIPSSWQVGVREADEVITFADAITTSINQAGLDEAITRVIPAGSIAWTMIIEASA